MQPTRGRVRNGAEAEDRFPQGRVREACPREPVDGQMEPEPLAHDARASPRRCMSAETTAAARSFHPGANTRVELARGAEDTGMTQRRQTRLPRPRPGNAARPAAPPALALWRLFEAGSWEEARRSCIRTSRPLAANGRVLPGAGQLHRRQPGASGARVDADRPADSSRAPERQHFTSRSSTPRASITARASTSSPGAASSRRQSSGPSGRRRPRGAPPGPRPKSLNHR